MYGKFQEQKNHLKFLCPLSSQLIGIHKELDIFFCRLSSVIWIPTGVIMNSRLFTVTAYWTFCVPQTVGWRYQEGDKKGFFGLLFTLYFFILF